MKKVFVLFILLAAFSFSSSQTYQLTGNPVNTTGWSLVADAATEDDFIRLTPDVTWQNGAIKLDEAIQLNSCDKWRVEFEFRIDGYGTSDLKMGDGIAFWYIANPPVAYEQGAGLGIPPNAVGLMVGFDTFNNTTSGQMSKIHVLYGLNTGNIEFDNTPGSSYHTPDLQSSQPFVGPQYKQVTVTGERDSVNSQRTLIKLWMDGTLLVNQLFLPSGIAATMTRGYFGFSASTGGASSRHSIRNVKVFVDRVPVLEKEFSPVFSCPDIHTGELTFNLKSLEKEMVSEPADCIIDYFESTGVKIDDPEHYTFAENKTVVAIVSDSASTLCSSEVKIHLKGDFINVKDSSLEYCGSDGTGVYNLYDADVSATSGIRKEFYRSREDLLNGAPEIENPEEFKTDIFGDIYAKLILSSGCFRYAKINLVYKDKVKVNSDYLKECTPSWDVSEAVFDLSKAQVTNAPDVTVTYHKSPTDAQSGNGAIGNFTNFPSPSTTVFARVMPANGCYDIAEIELKAAKPVQIAKAEVKGNEITVTAVGGEPPLQYSVDDEAWRYSHVLTVYEGGSHNIRVKDDFECNIAEYKIIILNLPNIITPNGDGKNDTVDFALLSGKNNFRFEIFDRYGNPVFSSRSSSQTFWDGMRGGKALPSGTYWYYISWNEADFSQTLMKYSGWVYVKN